MNKLLLFIVTLNSYATAFTMNPVTTSTRSKPEPIFIGEYRGYTAIMTKDPNTHYYGKVLEIPVTFHGCRQQAAIKNFKLNIDCWIAYYEHINQQYRS